MKRCAVVALGVLGLLVAAAGSAQATYVTEVMAANPFLYLQMNETNVGHVTVATNSGSSTVTDYYCLGGGTQGSYTDVALSSLTGIGKQFNRVSDTSGPSIYVPAQGTAYGELSAYTIEFLLRPAEYNGLQAVFATNALSVHVNLNGGSLEMSGPGNSSSIDLGNLLPSGNTAHIAITYGQADGVSTAKYFVNGTLQGTSTGVGGTANFNGDSAIGMWASDWLGACRYFNGALDEFAIYGSTLSGDTILSHAVAGGFATVPEPTTLVLFTTGIFWLVCYALRKRKQS